MSEAKTLREVAEDAYSEWWRSPADEDPAGWREAITKATMKHAANLLRERGEQAKSYALQDCLNEAAAILESLE